MDAKQTKIVVGATFLVLLLWAVAIIFFGFREPDWPLSKSPLQFDANRAFRFTQEFVTRHPRRVLGSIEARQSTGYLRQELERMGYKISYTHFDAVIANRRQVGRNVLAVRPGATHEILAVVAHYDTARTTSQGAMDNGSGIGVLLELARIFATSTSCRSLQFVASDGEEWGMLGASDLARNLPNRERVVATLSLDYVAVGELSGLRLDVTGQMGGYAPAWLRDVFRRSAQDSGLPVLEPFGLLEHLERALLLSENDQGPFLNASIPAINLGSESRERAREVELYHSRNDLIENMKVSSFEIYGRVAERILRTLDEIAEIPRESMDSFRLRNGLYLPNSWITTSHYVTFLPFLGILYFHLMNHPKYLSPGRVQREAVEFLAVVLPLVISYACVLGFRRLGVLLRYSLYPPPPKDPVLEHPQWGILVGILAVLILAAAACYFTKIALTRNYPRPDFYISKSVLMTVFLVVIFVALQYNSYWAANFLAIPAWVWGMVEIGKGSGGRATNRIWIFAAGITYYLMTVFYAGRLVLGWKMIWYEILALANGMFRFEGALLAIATISLGLRFFAIQSYSRQ